MFPLQPLSRGHRAPAADPRDTFDKTLASDTQAVCLNLARVAMANSHRRAGLDEGVTKMQVK